MTQHRPHAHAHSAAVLCACLQFYTSYDTALRQYMAGLDLTLDMTPPKDVNVRVMVLKDGGSRALSHSLNVPLIPGSVHNLKCSDAEQLVRQGVLQVLDSNT
eukprot:GHRR01025797.1.p1 GENE.GHRR01025797.1~~GHRR01025797.1.p1  ORF type:complete len:102 (+),score=31.32 GHRR01025797.1:1260-1565(+)